MDARKLSLGICWLLCLIPCVSFANIQLNVSTQSKLEFRDTAVRGFYDMTLFLKMKETKAPEAAPTQVHSFQTTIKLPAGITAAKEDVLFNPALVSKEAGSLVNNSSFNAETNELILDYTVEAVAGAGTPGSFQLTDSDQEILRVPLKIAWSDEIFGDHVLEAPVVSMNVVSADTAQAVELPAENMQAVANNIDISHFMMYGEPLTQNGTEDFSDVKGYDPLIQGINYAFSGSGIWDPELQGWKAINGADITIVSLEETDAEGVPVPEENHIFRIVDKGLDNLELYSVPNAHGQSYLKFGLESKAYPTSKYPDEKVKTFIMSYLVDPADDPTIVSAKAGDGTEGQKYEITVDISDLDTKGPSEEVFKQYVDRDSYNHYIKIGEKLIPTDSIKHFELPTIFTINALPLDVVSNADGSRKQIQKLTVQAVFEKLYPPGKGDFTYSEPVEATFTDVEQAPTGDFTFELAPSGQAGKAVTPVINSTITDADGDEIFYKVVWTLQGPETRTIEGLTLPAQETQKGQVWDVTAQAYTKPYGEVLVCSDVKSATYTVADAAPVIMGLPDTLYIYNDGQSGAKSKTLTVRVVDLDETDSYAVKNFTVEQVGSKQGQILDKNYNPDTYEFSFTYQVAADQQITTEDHASLTINLAYGEGQKASASTKVLVMDDQEPAITVDKEPSAAIVKALMLKAAIREASTQEVAISEDSTLEVAISVADGVAKASGIKSVEWSMTLQDGLARGARETLACTETGFAAVEGTETATSKVSVPLDFEVLQGVSRTASALYVLTVTVRDKQAGVATRSWKVRVLDKDRTPDLNQAVLTNSIGEIFTGTPVTVTVSGVTDPDGDAVVSYAVNDKSMTQNAIDMETVLGRKLVKGDNPVLTLKAGSSPVYAPGNIAYTEKTFENQITVKNSKPVAISNNQLWMTKESSTGQDTYELDLTPYFKDADAIEVDGKLRDSLKYECPWNDDNPDGKYEISGNKLLYTPPVNYNDEGAILVEAIDESGEKVAAQNLRVLIRPVNNAPYILVKNIYHLPKDCDGVTRRTACYLVNMGGGEDEISQPIDKVEMRVVKDGLQLGLSNATPIQIANVQGSRRFAFDYVLPADIDRLMDKETVLQFQVTDKPDASKGDSLTSEWTEVRIVVGNSPWYPVVRAEKFQPAGALQSNGRYLVDIMQGEQLIVTLPITGTQILPRDYVKYHAGLLPGSYVYNVYAAGDQSKTILATAEIVVEDYPVPDQPILTVDALEGTQTNRLFTVEAPFASAYTLEITNKATDEKELIEGRFQADEKGLIYTSKEFPKEVLDPAKYEVQFWSWNPKCGTDRGVAAGAQGIAFNVDPTSSLELGYQNPWPTQELIVKTNVKAPGTFKLSSWASPAGKFTDKDGVELLLSDDTNTHDYALDRLPIRYTTTGKDSESFWVTVTVSIGKQPEALESSNSIKIFMRNLVPSWSGEMTLAVRETIEASLDLSKYVSSQNMGEVHTYGIGDVTLPKGVTCRIEGSVLKVLADDTTVTPEQQTLGFDLPVTVKDSVNDPVSGTVTITVTDVMKLMASEVWGAQVNQELKQWRWKRLHFGWNLISQPVVMSAQDSAAFWNWLRPVCIWSWNSEASSYAAMADKAQLPCQGTYWVYLSYIPQQDFELIGTKPAPCVQAIGWQLIPQDQASGLQGASFRYDASQRHMTIENGIEGRGLGVWHFSPKSKKDNIE